MEVRSSSAQFNNPAEWDAVEEEWDMKWSCEARVMLIDEIRARPALWPTSHQSRRYDPYLRQLRTEVAQLIATKFGLNITCDDVAQQWKYLSRHHRNYLRNRARFENDGHPKRHEYPVFKYAKHMKFVEDRYDVSMKEAISNGHQKVQDDTSVSFFSSDGSHDSSHEKPLQLPPYSDINGSCLFSSTDHQRVFDASFTGNVSERAVQPATTTHDNQTSLLKGDENDQLGKTVASALRRAAAQDPMLAQQFRSDITKMLFALEEKILNVSFDMGAVNTEIDSRHCCLMDSIRSLRGDCNVAVRMPRHSLTRSLLEMDFPRKDPPLDSFCEILNDRVALEEFLVLMKLMPQSALRGDSRIYHGACVLSENCDGLMYTAVRKGRPAYRCNRCGKIRSVGHGDINRSESRSFFYRVDESGRPHTRISREAILWIVYCTAKEISSADMVRLADPKFRVTKVTIIDWQNNLRELMRKELESRAPLGGQGRAVQVDEFQGHKNEEGYGNKETGSWIFGMLDMTTRECRFFHVPHRDAKTLVPIIQQNVAPGSTIVSSGWEAYRGIEDVPNMSYRHLRDNQSVDRCSDSSAPSIKTVWRGLQSRISKTSPALLTGHLVLQWWLSLNGKQVATDPFLRLCDLIAKYFPQ